MMKLLNIFKYPAIRHLLAGVFILAGVYFFVLRPLQVEISALHEQINKDRALIHALSQKDTYSIKNSVDVKKQKAGSNIQLVPDNVLSVENKEKTDTIIKKPPKKRWWKFWK